MWSVITRELKDRKWSLLAYSVVSLLLLWTYVATFRSSQSSTQQLQQLVKTYPKGLLAAFGLNNLAVDTIEKYLNLKHFSFVWPLLAIILALSRAASQIAGEIQSGTMGLLMALPLERWRIFLAKYIAGVITIVAFTVVSVFGIIPFAAAYGIPTDGHILLSAWILTAFFMWGVYALGVALSTMVSESAKVYAIMGFILVASYTVNIVSLLVNSWDKIKYASIFYYFDTQDVLATGHIKANALWFFIGVILAASVLAAWRFNRRDVYV